MRTPNTLISMPARSDTVVDLNSTPAAEMGDPSFQVLRDHMAGQGLPLPIAHRLAAMVAHTMQHAHTKPKGRPELKRKVPQGLAAPIGRKGNMGP